MCSRQKIIIVACKINQQRLDGCTPPPPPPKACATWPWQEQHGQTDGPTLPSAQAGEPHSSHTATTCTTESCSQDTVSALGLARLKAVVAQGTNTELPGYKGTGATCQHHAALCPHLSQVLDEQERPISTSPWRGGFPFLLPQSLPRCSRIEAEMGMGALTFMVPLLPGGEGDMDPPQHFAERAAMAGCP